MSSQMKTSMFKREKEKEKEIGFGTYMHALSLTFCFVTICQKTNLQLANPQTTISQKTNPQSTNLQHLLSLPGVKIFWIFFHKNYQNKLFHLRKCLFCFVSLFKTASSNAAKWRRRNCFELVCRTRPPT
jgi:hypothetical protein